MTEKVKNNNGRGGKQKIEFTEELVQRVLDLAIKNNSAMDISKETKISYPIVRKLMRSTEYQGAVRAAMRQKLSQFIGLTAKVIEDQLKEGNLEAAKIVLKTYSLLDPEPITAQKVDTGITVIVPPGVFSPQKEIKNVDVEVSQGEQGETE